MFEHEVVVNCYNMTQSEVLYFTQIWCELVWQQILKKYTVIIYVL